MTPRVLLGLAAVAVAFAAIDTYVVVLALPDMMAAAGIPVDELQRAAPIVSGFLLGYVAMLPLIGRIADLRGPVPVLVMALVVFSVGSLLTSISYDLATMVAGRFLQGVGGGGLVPATMALVAATYPVERRGLPLGLVSAVQEFGAVLGPLFGAVVLSFSSWRAIFAINLLVGVLLAVTVRSLRGTSEVPELGAAAPGTSTTDVPSSRQKLGFIPLVVGVLAGLVAAVAGWIEFIQPASIKRDLTWGELFVPYVVGGGRWETPIGVITLAALLVLLVSCLVPGRNLVDLRGWFRSLADADLTGAALFAVALAGVVLAFATADPEVAVFNPQGPWFLLGSAVALVLLLVHLRRSATPIVPRGALRAVPAWGSLLVSFLVGWALIAALVDVPLLARTTTEETQLGAALILLRFLVALPIGAVIGGWLLHRAPAGVLTAAGMVCASVSFFWMAQWGQSSLDQLVSNVPLVLGGFGFGLALAPVNAAMLASTSEDAHGLASALVVVARMVGMLVGISVLTTWGLRRLYAEADAHPGLGTKALALIQERAVFTGAGVAAALAAVLALAVFARARTRAVDVAEVLRAAG
ncbi:MFS transporter [Nocardioides panacisoli]|uniref:Major facilitator superfamily (MFS) profile domain-containing protein n=1 Tax=Nocardioides panacisoli TaxID=627624 RepID=A0ABP7I8F9_9ACTN